LAAALLNAEPLVAGLVVVPPCRSLVLAVITVRQISLILNNDNLFFAVVVFLQYVRHRSSPFR